MRFEILPLGIGEYFTRRYYNANFLIFLGDQKVAVDCPGPYRRILHESGKAAGMELDYADIDEIILTHLHGDHSNGLEGLLFYRYFVSKQKTKIYTSPEVATDLWENKLSASMSYCTDCEGYPGPRNMKPEMYYDLVEWPYDSTQELHGARFEMRQTAHPVPTFGFRCWFEGRSFAYSCDTIFDPEYIEWLAECDLVIHECNSPPLHTLYEKLLTLDPATLDKMRLIHISDNFDVEGSKIKVLKQGELLQI